VLARTFGCVRYVYNWALRKKTDVYYQQGERLYSSDLSSALTELKKQDETAWLNEVSSVPLQQVLRHLERAFLAKSISDVGWGEFVRQLEYKAAWHGRTFVKIDKFSPSSKRCFACGHVLQTLSLDVREWACPQCGVHHDRDINAANNILAAGLAVHACGESVRPGRVKTQPGNSRRSRKAS
jgi:putative transposase